MTLQIRRHDGLPLPSGPSSGMIPPPYPRFSSYQRMNQAMRVRNDSAVSCGIESSSAIAYCSHVTPSGLVILMRPMMLPVSRAYLAPKFAPCTRATTLAHECGSSVWYSHRPLRWSSPYGWHSRAWWTQKGSHYVADAEAAAAGVMPAIAEQI